MNSRTNDNNVPNGFRLELVDAVYLIFERTREFNERKLYQIILQSLGIVGPGSPMAGFRDRIGKEVVDVPWQRVLDLVVRLRAEVPTYESEYREVVNRLLSGYGLVWDLGEDGRLHRILPPVVQNQVEESFRELSLPRFAATLGLFRAAMMAYDDRPQRGREACKNIFDALESVSKEVFGLPAGTFGSVLAEVRKRPSMAPETISVLQKLYDMANGHFRHGMTTPFTLKAAEVDFVLVSSIAGILLFVRL